MSSQQELSPEIANELKEIMTDFESMKKLFGNIEAKISRLLKFDSKTKQACKGNSDFEQSYLGSKATSFTEIDCQSQRKYKMRNEKKSALVEGETLRSPKDINQPIIKRKMFYDSSRMNEKINKKDNEFNQSELKKTLSPSRFYNSTETLHNTNFCKSPSSHSDQLPFDLKTKLPNRLPKCELVDLEEQKLGCANLPALAPYNALPNLLPAVTKPVPLASKTVGERIREDLRRSYDMIMKKNKEKHSNSKTGKPNNDPNHSDMETDSISSLSKSIDRPVTMKRKRARQLSDSNSDHSVYSCNGSSN